MAIIRSTHATRWSVPSPYILVSKALAYAAARKRRNEVAGLLDCDEWLLRDMGITRGDVVEALAKPGDPSFRLRHIAANRRFNERNRDAL